MTAGDRVQGVLAGLIAGIAGGLFGVGGGIVLVPLLTGRFHLTQHQAHGTSLAVVGITAIAGLIVYGAFAQVAWGTAAVIAISSVITARYGARWAARTSSLALRRGFAVLLVAVALKLLLQPPTASGPPVASGPLLWALELAIGAGVGLLSGYMGVGGGLIAVPAFTFLLGMSQHAAQGTSLAVILVTGPVGAFEHSRHGNLVWKLVPILALGAVVGSPFSSWLAQVLPRDVLVKLFAAFLLVNAALTWIKTGRPKAPAVPSQAPGR